MASDLRFAIEAAFRRENIEIPFPQRDLHIRSVEPGSFALGQKEVIDISGDAPETTDSKGADLAANDPAQKTGQEHGGSPENESASPSGGQS